MELRPGYKRTEVGIIPEEWDVQPLAERGTFAKGSGVRKDQAASGSIPCVRYGELYTDHHEIIRAFPSKISQAVARAARRLAFGDVIFAASGETKEEIGKCAAFVDKIEAYAGGDTIIFSPRCDDSYFLGYALNQPIAARQKAARGQGDAVVHISARSLGDIRFPFPPLPEQKAIAEALSDVDASIAALSRLIAKKRDLRQGAMQRLLTGQTRLQGFEVKWKQKRVREFGQVVTGGTPATSTASYWGGEYPWVTPTDIGSSRDIYASERSITSIGLRSIRCLPENSLLVTCIASIGKNAILRRPGACNQQINAIIPNVESSVEFLYYLFEFHKGTLIENSGITATRILSKKAFAELEFLVPDKPEQGVIAAALSDMDAEIFGLEANLDKTRALKQAMMQALLTGRVRLPVRPDAAPQTKEAAHV